MKIAVLSDIHGNVPALEAVLDDLAAWGPDEVIVNGDLINRGPCSLAVLRLLQRHRPGCRFLKGNHEAFVLHCDDRDDDPEAPTYDLRRFAHWTCARMNGALEEVRAWDDHLDLTDLEGGSFHVTHGSRLGNRDGILPETEPERLRAKLGEPRDLFIGSHTHRPLVRRFDGNLVVNTGSVGQPFDGDPRAAYGRFEFRSGGWQAHIARVAYDRSRALQDFIDTGFLEGGGPLASIIHRELQESRMLLGRWMGRYQDAVKAGTLSVADGVAAFLREC